VVSCRCKGLISLSINTMKGGWRFLGQLVGTSVRFERLETFAPPVLTLPCETI
jgi:hypothetical protein